MVVVLIVLLGLRPTATLGSFQAQLMAENSAGIGMATTTVTATPVATPSMLPTAAREAAKGTCREAIAAAARQGGAFTYQVAKPKSGKWLDDLSHNGNDGYVGVPGMKTVFGNPCARDETVSASIPSKKNAYIATSKQYPSLPGEFSVELWIRTSQRDGTLAGFYSNQTPDGGRGSAAFKLNIDPISGGLVFATQHTGGFDSIVSNVQVADGMWHHVVARRTDYGELAVFTDGSLTAKSVTAAQGLLSFPGYFRLGCDRQIGWPGLQGGSACFAGDMAYAAGYTRALSDADIAEHYSVSR